VYDAFGRRMSKMISGTTTQFLYDGLNPVQELNSTGGVVANMLTGLRVDEYFTRTDTATSTFLADALGSTVGLVGLRRLDLNELHVSALRCDHGRRFLQRQFVPVHRP